MENNDNCCIAKILKVIDILQRESTCDLLSEGCDKPFLGNGKTTAYNTRPIQLYTRAGNLFNVNYYVNNNLTTSNVFRVEDVNGCCAKLRILKKDCTKEITTYDSTNEFVTVNLECFCIVRCLADTYVEI